MAQTLVASAAVHSVQFAPLVAMAYGMVTKVALTARLLKSKTTAIAARACAMTVKSTRTRRTGSLAPRTRVSVAGHIAMSVRHVVMACGTATKTALTARHLEGMVPHGIIIEVARIACATIQKLINLKRIGLISRA